MHLMLTEIQSFDKKQTGETEQYMTTVPVNLS